MSSPKEELKKVLVLKHPLLFQYDIALYLNTEPSNFEYILLYFSQDVSEYKFNKFSKVAPHINIKKRYFVPFSIHIEFKNNIIYKDQEYESLDLPAVTIFKQLPYYIAFDITPIPTFNIFTLNGSNMVKEVKNIVKTLSLHKESLEKFICEQSVVELINDETTVNEIKTVLNITGGDNKYFNNKDILFNNTTQKLIPKNDVKHIIDISKIKVLEDYTIIGNFIYRNGEKVTNPTDHLAIKHTCNHCNTTNIVDYCDIEHVIYVNNKVVVKCPICKH